MRFCITLSLVFICLNTLKAQDPKLPRQIYFFLGIGLPIVHLKDEGHSPMKYQGWMPTLRLGYEQVGQDYVSRVAASASIGSARPKSNPKPQRSLSITEVNNIQFSYAFYKRSGAFDTEGWNHYWGGALTFTFDIRNYNLPSNNLVGYQTNVSLNAGTFIQNKISNTWRFNYEAFTPIISYALRPSYLGMFPMTGSEFKVKSAFSNGKIVTVNNLRRFYNRFSFDQQVKDYRQRRLNYTWDYHSNTVSKPLKSVSGGFGYESLFKM